jgi:cell division GTPase FtsZ
MRVTKDCRETMPRSFSTIPLRKNYRLTDFPLFRETYGKKITVVGLATRGCKIANELSLQCKQLSSFLYISCDEEDLANISSGKKIALQVSNANERTPSNVRGMVMSQLEQVKQALEGSQVVFIIAGLGGSIGSGLAPLVAACAKQVHAMAVGIISMPFMFEKHRYFFAGCALRQLTLNCDGIMLLENGILIKDEIPLIDANASLYEKLSLAINELVQPIEQDGSSAGVEDVVDFIKANPFSVVQSSNDFSVDNYETEVVSDSNSNVLISYQSMNDASRVINSYDPVDACLKSRQGNLDSDLDSSIGLKEGILRNLEE